MYLHIKQYSKRTWVDDCSSLNKPSFPYLIWHRVEANRIEDLQPNVRQWNSLHANKYLCTLGDGGNACEYTVCY